MQCDESSSGSHGCCVYPESVEAREENDISCIQYAVSEFAACGCSMRSRGALTDKFGEASRDGKDAYKLSSSTSSPPAAKRIPKRSARPASKTVFPSLWYSAEVNLFAKAQRFLIEAIVRGLFPPIDERTNNINRVRSR